MAGFKLKKDQPLGLQLTLRRDKMNSFLKNLIFIVLPKFVDFSGVPTKNLDSQGNIHFGSTQFSFGLNVKFHMKSLEGLVGSIPH